MNEEKPRPEKSNSESMISTSFWSELKRRKVMRVAITYALVAWLIMQVAATTFPTLMIPDWALRLVTMCIILGFPVAVILAWAFELTPDGITTTKRARQFQSDEPVSKEQQRKRNWMTLGFAAAAPTVIFGALAVYFYATRSGGETEAGEKSIAVLPLENMSPDPGNAFFADGVQEDILTNLSKIRALHVISRSSTLQYRDPERNLKQIGAELGARFVMEGSVRREGNQVRVTAQLIDTQTDKHLWAENFNRRLDDIFAIQAEIAQEIARQLQARISPDEVERIEKLPTSNQAAYDLFLKAREIDASQANRLPMPEEFEQIVRYLETAVELDPGFAAAYALLSSVYSERSVQLVVKDRFPDSIKEAREMAEKAEALDPSLPELLLAWGDYHYHGFLDYARAAENYFAALAQQPSSAEAYEKLGVIQRRQGRWEDAIQSWEKALSFDPKNPGVLGELAETHSRFRRYGLAESLAVRLLELDPENAQYQFLKEQSSFQRSGDMRFLLAAIKRLPEWFPAESSLNYLADVTIQYAKGDFAAALAAAESLEISYRVPDSVWTKPAATARAAWLLRDQNQAGKAAREAVEAHEELTQSYQEDWRRFSAIAEMYAILGDRSQVERYRKMTLESIVGTRDEIHEEFVVRERLLPSYLVLGETEEALAILDELLSQPSNVHAEMIRVDPYWRSFNGDPRFEAILAKAKSVD